MNTDPIEEITAPVGEDQISTSRSKLHVTSSPKVELMLVTAMLVAPSKSPGHYGNLDHPITQAARRWFMPFTDHPAVRTFRQLFYGEQASAFACDAILSYILRRKAPPDLGAQYAYSKSALSCAKGEVRILDEFADQLGDFYQVSHFASFWEMQRKAYLAVQEQVAGSVQTGWSGEDVVKTMENYFGREKSVYILVPTPMERPGGGSMDAPGGDDHAIIACFDCTVNKDWILYLLYHEVGHSFVNPLADQYESLVQQYEGLYAPIKEEMRPWGYVNWKIALNEHILRAQNCRLRRLLLGDEAAEELLSKEESQGFRYIRPVDAKLAEYEAQRDRYVTLADFYPALLTALDHLRQ